MQIRDRIKEFRRVPARQLRSHPRNWRLHPPEQQAALRGVLTEIGFADALEPPEEFDFGALLGTVELYDCLPLADVDDPFASGPECFMLRKPKSLKSPVAYKGSARAV